MNGILRANSGLYIVVVVLVALAVCAGELLRDNIFACSASGYGSDRYLAYCHADHYGDYDHGAFWFALEPAAGASARSAQVLFMGNSRLQWAFSTTATASWFASIPAHYYLLGFGHSETYLFEEHLLRKLEPRAKVYVINLDSFFEGTASQPAQFVMNDGDALRRYQDKRHRQLVHQFICTRIPALCGNEFEFFRSRLTGRWFGSGGVFHGQRVSEDALVDDDLVSEQVASGLGFLSHLPVNRDCVILTIVPTVNTPYTLASAIAARLQAPLIAPRLDGLYTFDGSHLDSASAELWSRAFLQAAAPQIQQCLNRPAPEHSYQASENGDRDRSVAVKFGVAEVGSNIDAATRRTQVLKRQP